MGSSFVTNHGEEVLRKAYEEQKNRYTTQGGILCNCGAICMFFEDEFLESDGICGGEIHVSETYPGTYAHYCQNHSEGHGK